ncbi:MAG: SH3 domain-containing protein, partial [Anaerolineae bacterium]|nr:SH3 domain-containing protein [Anaerolineae bacterium]
ASVAPQPGQGGGASGTTVTVTSARLNVRAAPDVSGAILVKISANETYPVTGKNANASWYQINVNGVVGWVSARFVRLNGSTDVPVIGTSTGLAQPVDTGYITTALATVNVRNAPNVRSGAILVKMQRGETARVIGRTSDNRWWMVNFNGTTGWVSSTYAQLQPNAELTRIPVTA